MNKNILLFAGESCHPQGGILDYKDSFHTPEEAVSTVFKHNTKADMRLTPRWDWYQIVDRTTMEVLKSSTYERGIVVY